MKPLAFVRRVERALLLAGAAAVLPARVAPAQTTTGAIRGYVRDSSGAALGGTEVQARNLASGVARTATTLADGAYILPGLVPGTYDLVARHIGNVPQGRRVAVQIGATLVADFALAAGAVELQAVTVETATPVIETRTSEVATNVTQQQIGDLPTSSRNFLDLAVLAPGTNIQNDRINGTARAFSAGAQAADQTNLFIDGASYKNDLIHGGAVGQDRSRGNPFPRNAVQEFRILTQNYKAEYQRASSAIITATTKSGGNEWRGNAFFGYQNKDLVVLDSFQIRDKNKADSIARATGNPSTFRKPEYNRDLLGLSIGGPIIRDRLHIFASYEGNYQDRNNQVNIIPPLAGRFPLLDTVKFGLRNGFFTSPFRSTLVFGKLTYDAGPHSSLELSLNTRHETDLRDFGADRPLESGVHFRNDVTTGVLKYSHFLGAWLEEAAVNFQRARDNPSPVPGPEVVNRFYGGAICCAQLGPDITVQDFRQQRLGVRNDLTYSGLQWNGQHVIKTGASLDFLYYKVLKQNSVVPRFVYEQCCFGAGVDSFAIPERVEFQAGNPNFVTDNTQFGVYVQDDWSPTRQLMLNLGIRWDYETHMLNYDYVTPQPIVDSLTKYASRMFIPIDPNRYFTDGTDRPRFKGAFQPRLGLSYALDEAGRTTLFGGFGIFYDRTLFDQAVEEKFAQQEPRYVIHFRKAGDATAGRVDWNNAYLLSRTAVDSLRLSNLQVNTPLVKLLPNDLRPPKSRQFSVGVRKLLWDFAVEAAYTGVRSSDVFTFSWANSNFTCPQRSFGAAGCFQDGSNPANAHHIPGYAIVLLGTNAGKTWYNALQVRVDRPYRPAASGRVGWGAGLAYTYAKRETQGFNDDFSFPNPVDYPRQVRNDERQHLVANWILDVPFAYGVQFGGLITLGSGVRQDIGDRFGNELDLTQRPFVPGGFDTPNFKNIDLRLRKDFPSVSGTTLGLTVDLFNAFNWQNLGCYDHLNARVNDATFGNAECTISDPRRLQIGAEYRF